MLYFFTLIITKKGLAVNTWMVNINLGMIDFLQNVGQWCKIIWKDDGNNVP